MPHTIERLHITVSDSTYSLSPLERIDDLKSVMTEAVRAGGGFVDVLLDDGRRLSLLVGPTTAIIISAQTVHLDASTADGIRYSRDVVGDPWDGYDGTSSFDYL